MEEMVPDFGELSTLNDEEALAYTQHIIPRIREILNNDIMQ